MKGYIALVTLLAFNAAVAAQNIEIDGKSFAFTAAPEAEGRVLVFGGTVADGGGRPVEGAEIRIWQTDAEGVYDHPGERNRAARDREFQFYGSAGTDAGGRYAFRTIVPGEYAPRPRHIHFKVFIDGREELTSQIYFNLPEDTVRPARTELVMPLTPIDQTQGFRGRFDIVLDRGGGALTPTPSQSEGPYYPRADVSAFDNDLVIAE